MIRNECAELFAISIHLNCSQGSIFLLPFISLIKTFQIDQKVKLAQITVILWFLSMLFLQISFCHQEDTNSNYHITYTPSVGLQCFVKCFCIFLYILYNCEHNWAWSYLMLHLQQKPLSIITFWGVGSGRVTYHLSSTVPPQGQHRHKFKVLKMAQTNPAPGWKTQEEKDE